MSRRNSLPTISEELQFRDLGSFRFRRQLRTTSSRRSLRNLPRQSSLLGEEEEKQKALDLSNLASLDRTRVARLQSYLQGLCSMRKRAPFFEQETKASAKMYPCKSLIEAIPDIDALDVLVEECGEGSTQCSSDTEDSSNGTLESVDPKDSIRDEVFCQPWRNQNPTQNTSCSTPGAHVNYESQQEPIYVEIEKGKQARLRGADEMLRAVEMGFLAYTDCMACSCRVCCVADAALVLCPECRMISPIERRPSDTRGVQSFHGVGLGMRA